MLFHSLPHILANWVLALTFFTVQIGMGLWCLKARFWGADRTFLKLDKYLRKQGMMGLLTFIQVFSMSLVIFFGMLQMFVMIGLRLGY